MISSGGYTATNSRGTASPGEQAAPQQVEHRDGRELPHPGPITGQTHHHRLRLVSFGDGQEHRADGHAFLLVGARPRP